MKDQHVQCSWWDTNCRPLVSEATTLPAEPPPLPCCFRFDSHEHVNGSSRQQIFFSLISKISSTSVTESIKLPEFYFLALLKPRMALQRYSKSWGPLTEGAWILSCPVTLEDFLQSRRSCKMNGRPVLRKIAFNKSWSGSSLLAFSRWFKVKRKI